MMVGKDHLCPGQNAQDCSILELRSDDVEDLSGPRQSIDMDLLGVDRFVRAKDKRLTLDAKTNELGAKINAQRNRRTPLSES